MFEECLWKFWLTLRHVDGWLSGNGWCWQRDQYTNTLDIDQACTSLITQLLNQFFFEWHFSSFFFLPLHSLEFWRVWRRDGIFCVACAGLRQGQTFEFYFCGTLCWKVPQKGGFGAAVPNCGDSYGNTVHNTPDTRSRAVTALLAFRNLLLIVKRRHSCRKNSVFNLRIGVLLWKWGWTKVQWRGCSTKPRASWLAITHHQR